VNLRLDWCSYQAAKYAVLNWHYSKCMPLGKLATIGVWEDKKFIGAIVFGYGNNQYQGDRFNLTQFQVVELLRVALKNHTAPVTKINRIALQLLKQKNPGLRLVVSYADPEQGHNGAIYQAGNWVYIGTGGSREAFYNEQGKRLHSRRVGKGGVKSIFGQVVKVYDSDKIERRKLKPKYKYLYPLDDAMRKQIEQLRKPYPKRQKDSSEPLDDQSKEGGAAPTLTLQ
jgi:hypothetical protein